MENTQVEIAFGNQEGITFNHSSKCNYSTAKKLPREHTSYEKNSKGNAFSWIGAEKEIKNQDNKENISEGLDIPPNYSQVGIFILRLEIPFG